MPDNFVDVFDEFLALGVDPLSSASMRNNTGFGASSQPAASQTPRSYLVPVQSAATLKRHLVRWLVPEQPIIDMYINPNNIKYSYKKILQEDRTKGGFVTQYWGEDLIDISIQGTTGTSGIEGINVLKDIYRNEQLMMDPYVQSLEAQSQLDENNFLISALQETDEPILSTLFDVITPELPINSQPAMPTLASLAFSVEMYFMGAVFRGYFTNFDFSDSADKLGLYDYSIGFKAIQERGYRRNYLAWQRSPVNGPSNSDPTRGTPYSFSQLLDSPGQQSVVINRTTTITSPNDIGWE